MPRPQTIAKRIRDKRDKTLKNQPGRLPEMSNPVDPMDGWDVKEAVKEMQTAVADASWYCKLVDQNERTRLCWWAGKHPSGRKVSAGNYRAQPFENAADHEVHLAQEIIDERTAMRLAAIQRGSLSVEPMPGTDPRQAANMKAVLRYYMENLMKDGRLIAALRAGSWADRHGCSGMHIHWHEQRGIEKKTLTLGDLVNLAASANLQRAQQETGGQIDPQMQQQIIVGTQDEYRLAVLDPLMEDMVSALLLDTDPGLVARGKAGIAEAKRAIREVRSKVLKTDSPEMASLGVISSEFDTTQVEYFSSFVKASHPVWEANVWFVDAFLPAETEMCPALSKTRWIVKCKWLSAQQLREYGSQIMPDGERRWDEEWVEEVIEKHRGKATAFDTYMQQIPWILSGVGVRWVTNSATAGVQTTSEAHRNLFQIFWVWDVSTTPDGLLALYQTELHADITDKVARRELLPHWDGEYPWVAFTCEKDEKMMLASRGVPERVRSAQNAIKAQWDSRTDMASMTTLPPWTGPEELRGLKLHPGMFVPQTPYGNAEPMRFPPPDGRSIEIEKTIRAGVDAQFGRISPNVQDSVSMLRGQSEMDWFLSSLSQCVAKTARLIQQFMPDELKFRLLGSPEEFTFTRDDVRGNFNFGIKLDVRQLDIEWAKEMLSFVKDLILPLDRKAQVDTTPSIEFGLSILGPDIARQSIKPVEQASEDEQKDERNALDEIFSGGGPAVQEGMDYATRANTMMEEYQRSPLRQQMVGTNPQIHEVFTGRLKQLVMLNKQYTDNVVTGQLQGESPLKPMSAAEQLLQQLEMMNPKS